MIIWMIWAAAAGVSPLELTLVDAWDDDAVSGNREGWENALTVAADMCGAENIRVVKTSVDFDGVLKAFEVPTVGSHS